MVSSPATDKAVVGTAAAGVTITIKSGRTILGTTTAKGSGTLSYGLTAANLITLGQGTRKSLTATDSDSAGNISAASVAVAFPVRTFAPATPVI